MGFVIWWLLGALSGLPEECSLQYPGDADGLKSLVFSGRAFPILIIVLPEKSGKSVCVKVNHGCFISAAEDGIFDSLRLLFLQDNIKKVKSDNH